MPKLCLHKGSRVVYHVTPIWLSLQDVEQSTPLPVFLLSTVSSCLSDKTDINGKLEDATVPMKDRVEYLHGQLIHFCLRQALKKAFSPTLLTSASNILPRLSDTTF